ncbi:MAG TPA: hypothetical protein VNS19_00525 [Acidimicrobiales bacterium]|jgi:hypothetical protein|nr:hypothetical protein [Acidimicrobiales bacterium]
MLFANVWHFWIAVPLTLGAVLFGVAIIVGYLNKVVKPKYPPRGQG